MATKKPAVDLQALFSSEHFLGELEALVRGGVHPDSLLSPTLPKQSALGVLCGWGRRIEALDSPATATQVVALIELLITNGADVNRKQGKTETALSEACWAMTSHPVVTAAIIQRLLNAGAQPSLCKQPAICLAIGMREVRGELITVTARTDTQMEEQAALLETVRRLANADDDINRFDSRGRYNPLLLAAYYGSPALIQVLLDCGADPHALNKDGCNALMFVAGDVDMRSNHWPSGPGFYNEWHSEGDSLAATYLLLRLGVDPTLTNRRKHSALRIAIGSGCHEVALELAKAMAAQEQLTTRDIRLFADTNYEEQARTLKTSAIKTVPKPKDNSGATQMATWAKAREELVDNKKGGAGRSDLFRAYLVKIIDGLAGDEATPGYAKTLYMDINFYRFQVSKTKAWNTLSGSVVLYFADLSTELRVQYSSVEDVGCLVKDEVVLACKSNKFPEVAEVISLVREFCIRHLCCDVSL